VEESAIEFWDPQHHPQFSPLTSWIKDEEGWSLYYCETGIEPNLLPQLESDSGLVQLSWRDLQLSSGITRVPVKTTLTRVSDFLTLDGTDVYHIPLLSWRRAQPFLVNRIKICQAVVEKSAFKSKAHQLCNFINHSPLVMTPVLVWCWQWALYSLGITFRIGLVVGVEYCSRGPGVWVLRVLMKESVWIGPPSSWGLRAQKPPWSAWVLD